MSFWNVMRCFKQIKDSPLLEDIIDCMLVHILARQKKIFVSENELQNAADWFRKRLGLKKAVDTFAYLEQEGLEVTDLEFLLETQLLYHKMRQSLSNTDSVQKVFARNVTMFEVVELAGLCFEIREAAEAFYIRLIEGRAQFPDPVEKPSERQPGEKHTDYIGFVTRTDLDEESATNVFADDASEFVGPIENDSGFWIYHILLPKRVIIDETVYDLCEELLIHEYLCEKKQELFGFVFNSF